jgi:hypothetical protein
MANSPFYNLLHAYALGSLNNQDVKELKSYLKSGSEFEWAELGEYQNLAALLPSILNLENPPAKLKDKVARKLYRIRDERRKTIIDERRRTRVIPPLEEAPVIPAVEELAPLPVEEILSSNNQEAENSSDPIGNISQEDLESIMAQSEQPQDVNSEEFKQEIINDAKGFSPEEISEPVIPAPEPELPNADPVEEQAPLAEEAAEETQTVAENADSAEEKQEAVAPTETSEPAKNPILERLSGGDDESALPKPRGRKGLWSMVIFLLLVVIALGAAIYFIYNQLNRNKRELEDLRRQVNTISMRSDAGADILSIVTSKNYKTADLTPVKQNASGYGKIFMSYDLKIAYFEYADIPEPAANKTYHLWAKIAEEFISLGEFKPKGTVNIEPIPKLPVIDKDKSVAFVLTQENSGGNATAPSSNIYLTGEAK